MTIKKFEFNPFSENTYVLSDASGKCVIIDPGCCNSYEYEMLNQYISSEKLIPEAVWLTHAHVDHVAGLKYVCDKYGVGFSSHQDGNFLLKQASLIGKMYGLNFEDPDLPSRFFNNDDVARFGSSEFEVVFTPGHCPGEVCFIHHSTKSVIAGDVLFYESIGRTDLPGGDFDLLMHSIKSKLFTLPEDYVVFCGHGPETTIGHEKLYNPFLNR